MARQVFINLPVKDLAKSQVFFESLGFGFKQKFTNDVAACLVVDDNISVMLVTHDHFRKFTRKKICDAQKNTEVLLCLSCQSRSEVDDLVLKAVRAGGSIPRKPEDHGFMYGHAFEDPDGHIWELIFMEEDKHV